MVFGTDDRQGEWLPFRPVISGPLCILYEEPLLEFEEETRRGESKLS